MGELILCLWLLGGKGTEGEKCLCEFMFQLGIRAAVSMSHSMNDAVVSPCFKLYCIVKARSEVKKEFYI